MRNCISLLRSFSLLASACSDATTTASLNSRNKMKDLSIHYLTVNGLGGPDVVPEFGS